MARSDEFNRPKITNLGDFTTNRDGTGKQSYNFTIEEQVSKPAEYYQHQDKRDYRSVNNTNISSNVSDTSNEVVEEISQTQQAQALTNNANSFVRTHLTTVAVVATTVTTSVLTIINIPVTLDVSLYSATAQSLIFNVTLALEEGETEHNLFMATLSHEDEKYEQEIMDGVYLVFEDLYPETEYDLEIFEYTYVLPEEDKIEGEVETEIQDEPYVEPQLNIVSRYKASYRTLPIKEEESYQCFVEYFVEEDNLLDFMVFFENEDELDVFYTATVTNADGKKLGAFDSTEREASYRVDIGENEIVYISVKINNKLVAFQTVYNEHYEPYNGYDYSNITWTWDGISATAFVPNYNPNEEGLTLNAEVSLRDSYEASCVSEGYDIYVATIYDEYGYSYVDEHEIITSEALGHNYETNWIWNEEGNSAYVYLYCEVCGSYEYVDATVMMSSEKQASCEEDGYVIYEGSIEYEDIVYTDTHEITLTAYGHAYSEEWSWNEDNEATLTLTCQNCNEIHNMSATVTSEEIEVSCDTDGSITYTATATYDGETYSDQKVLITEEAHGHDYETNWNWASDYSSATLTLTCLRGDVNETIVASVVIDSENSQEASCGVEGSRVYIATATYGEETFTDTANENLMPLEHDYQESWEWTESVTGDGGYEATLLMTCSNCGDVIPLTAEVTIESEVEVGCDNDGSITYKATVLYQDNEYTDTKTVVTEEALGHEYETSWDWASDHSSATLYLFCIREDVNEEIIATVTIDSENSTPAGCDEEGITTYVATATYQGETYTDTDSVTESPTGHDYQESWNWEESMTGDGGYTATLFLTCSNCGDVEEYQADVVMENSSEATCDEDGTATYVATIMVHDVEYTDTKTFVIDEALGHNYQANWSWEDDGNGTPTSASLYLFCEACETEVGPIDGTITSEQVSVTGSDPITVYTARATYGGIEYTSTYDG